MQGPVATSLAANKEWAFLKLKQHKTLYFIAQAA